MTVSTPAIICTIVTVFAQPIRVKLHQLFSAFWKFWTSRRICDSNDSSATAQSFFSLVMISFTNKWSIPFSACFVCYCVDEVHLSWRWNIISGGKWSMQYLLSRARSTQNFARRSGRNSRSPSPISRGTCLLSILINISVFSWTFASILLSYYCKDTVVDYFSLMTNFKNVSLTFIVIDFSAEFGVVYVVADLE